MKAIVNKVSGLDKVDLTGLAIGVVFIIPSCIALIMDVIVNGANML